MIFLRPLGHVDVWQVNTSLYRHRPLLSGENGCKRLYIRPLADEMRPIMEKWKSLANLISRADRMILQNLPVVELDEIYIEQLEPNAATNWERILSPSTCIHIGLVCTPLAMLYSGPASMSVQTGQIVAVEEGVWHSAVNHDPLSSRYHLVMSLRQKEQP